MCVTRTAKVLLMSHTDEAFRGPVLDAAPCLCLDMHVIQSASVSKLTNEP